MTPEHVAHELGNILIPLSMLLRTAEGVMPVDWMERVTRSMDRLLALAREARTAAHAEDAAVRKAVAAAPGKEHVICAAIWVDDGITRERQPMPSGIVFGGWRHHSCFDAIFLICPEVPRSEHVQGFITSTGRFVDREEGMRIAHAAGQLRSDIDPNRDLFSEDLY